MSKSFNLLHFTDPHLFAERDGVMRGVCTYDSLLRTLEHARERHWPADAILVTGDIAQDETRATYQLFREIFSDLGVPVYCLPGNHDSVADMQALLDRAPFQFCGHIRTPHWIVPLLNTHRPGKASGQLSQQELARLDTILRQHPQHHAMIALHHHPVPSRARWLDTVALRNPDELFAVLAGHAKVRALVWGHIHQVFEERRNGLALLATPSTCSQFLPRNEVFALDAHRPPGYRWLRLYDNGEIATAIEWCEQ